jgi:ubiquinone/menaquinone biosynthesis C-methylase UbiE
MPNICQGKPPAEMRVLEIGCGAGRITRALAGVFGEVHAVDVSGEMIAQARQALSAFPRVQLYRNNGMDLNVIPDVPFDFAFSTLVFQHIPSYPIIESYVREVHRLLHPGGLFKFQLNGGFRLRFRHRVFRFCFQRDPRFRADPKDTWLGARFSNDQAQALADRCGFECRYREGGGTQEFWLWFFKPK